MLLSLSLATLVAPQQDLNHLRSPTYVVNEDAQSVQKKIKSLENRYKNAEENLQNYKNLTKIMNEASEKKCKIYRKILA